MVINGERNAGFLRRNEATIVIKSGAARTLHEDVNYGNERGYQTVRTIGSIHIADDCARVIDNAEASRFLFSVRFNSCRLALRVVVAARAERFCPMKGPAARRLGGGQSHYSQAQRVFIDVCFKVSSLWFSHLSDRLLFSPK